MFSKDFSLIKLRNHLAKSYQNFSFFYKNLLINLEISQRQIPVKFYNVTFFNLINDILIDDKFWKTNRHKPLFGIPFSVKDIFCIAAEQPTTAGSQMMQNFYSPVTATIVLRAGQAGAILIGKTNLDEFGWGGTGTFSADGIISNPLDTAYVSGGSSSGAPWSLYTQTAVFAFGSDTGDSIRVPAANTGFHGFKPTFGAVSRFGLIPFSPAFDTIGIMTFSAKTMAAVCQEIFGYDWRDGVSQKISFVPSLKKKTPIIGYFDPFQTTTTPIMIKVYQKTIAKLKAHGFNLTLVQIPEEITMTLLNVYRLLAFTSGLSSIANQTGVTFGTPCSKSIDSSYDSLIEIYRTTHFGPEIRRRLLLGAVFLDPTLIHYQEIGFKYRQYIINYFTDLFKKYDFLIHPTTTGIPELISLIDQLNDEPLAPTNDPRSWNLIANFAGFPSYTFPIGWIKNFSLSINIFSEIGTDYQLIELVDEFTEIININSRFSMTPA